MNDNIYQEIIDDLVTEYTNIMAQQMIQYMQSEYVEVGVGDTKNNNLAMIN